MRVKGQKWFSTVHQHQVPLPTICPCACQPVAFDRASSLTFLHLTRSLLPCSQAQLLAVCSLRAPVLMCQMPSAFPPPCAWKLSAPFSGFGSKETSVLLKHLFTPLKTYHSNIMASLFVILPIRLQILRGKGPGVSSFPAASVIVAKHDSQ